MMGAAQAAFGETNPSCALTLPDRRHDNSSRS